MNVMEDGHEIRQAQRHDSRVTCVGRILRAASIDELPQLVNVLVANVARGSADRTQSLSIMDAPS